MNNIIYKGFSLLARLLSFTTAIASLASVSSVFSLSMALLFIIAVDIPVYYEIKIVIIVIVVTAHIGHGYQFGLFAPLKIRAPEANMRFLNEKILCNENPKLRGMPTSAELEMLLNLLLKLPFKNALTALIWATLGIISLTVTYLSVGITGRQIIFAGVIGVLTIFLHAAFTYILSELGVARIVSSCREQLLRYQPAYKGKVSFSLFGKFVILGYAFITALFNLFAIMFISRDNLTGTVAVLIYNILLMTFLGYLVLYRISASLSEIRQAATNLREGTNTLIYSKALDSEFVDIVDGLNSATLAIQDHQQNLENRIIERTQQLSEERDKSEKLLLNILPVTIADELKRNGTAKAVKFQAVTVIFTDFVGFTKIAETLTPEELIDELDKCFSYFDSVTAKYKLEKLKTIGDAYMCAGGIPNANKTHVIDSALAALEIQAFMNQMKEIKERQGFPYWELRLGMNTGELIAGVIGEKKFAYDVWGDTVNTASRMESSGTAGYINISSSTYDLLKYLFHCEYRGKIKAKNKGEIDMYYLKGIKKSYSVNGDGRTPNSRFQEIYAKIAAGSKLIPKKKDS